MYPPSHTRAADLRASVREKYRVVSRDVAGHFPYPVGRESAMTLGYDAGWLDAVPASAVEGFVGVGNPFRIRRPGPGERILDLGCGSGLDVFVAALLVGSEGRAVGVDITPEMVARAEGAARDWPHGDVDFVAGTVERLAFEDAAFDLVISNGALNLVPDKPAAFREAYRVLAPGGTLAVADLLVVERVPEAVLASMDAWST